METGLTILHKSKVPTSLWHHAFITAVYLINRIITPVLNQKSPYHVFFSQCPNHSKLRVFGCLCYLWIKPYILGKLEPKFTPCVFLGYSTSQSAYICLEPKTNRIYHSRHVRFCEEIFLFKNKVITHPILTTNTTTELKEIATLVPQIRKVTEATPTTGNPIASNLIFDINSPSSSVQAMSRLPPKSIQPTPMSTPLNTSPNNINQTMQILPPIPIPIQILANENQTSTVSSPAPQPLPEPIPNQTRTHPMQIRSLSNIHKPNLKYINLVTKHPLSQHVEPRMVTQAI